MRLIILIFVCFCTQHELQCGDPSDPYGESTFGFDGGEEQAQHAFERGKSRFKRLAKGRASRFSRFSNAVFGRAKRSLKRRWKSINPCASTGSPFARFFRCLISKGALRFGATASEIQQNMMAIAQNNPMWAGRSCEALCATGLRSMPMDTKNSRNFSHDYYAKAKATMEASNIPYSAQNEAMVEKFEELIGEVGAKEVARKRAVCTAADSPTDDAEADIFGNLSADNLLNRRVIAAFDRSSRDGATESAKTLLARDVGQTIKAYCTNVCLHVNSLKDSLNQTMGEFSHDEILEECRLDGDDRPDVLILERNWWDPAITQGSSSSSRGGGGFLGGGGGGLFGSSGGGFFGGGGSSGGGFVNNFQNEVTRQAAGYAARSAFSQFAGGGGY